MFGSPQPRLFVAARGTAPGFDLVAPALKNAREWSAERRHQQSCALRRRRVLRSTRSPLGAPPAAFLSPAPCFRARDGGLVPALIRAAFAALRPRRVQPFKADPLSRAGRLPEASRCRGYKPQQQAPPLPRGRQCPAERPSRGGG